MFTIVARCHTVREAGGMHEANQIAPGIAMLDRGELALTGQRPDLVQDGLQTNAVFVNGPELDARLRKGHRPRARASDAGVA
jgi:hypothetical protein